MIQKRHLYAHHQAAYNAVMIKQAWLSLLLLVCLLADDEDR